MASRVEKYLAHLDHLSDGVEPLFFPVESTTPGLPRVASIVYQGMPDGLLTAFTYGVSLAEHAEWQYGTPELCLSVRSADLVWAHALGFLADGLRATCPFTYGDTIDFGEEVAAESRMTAFCVFVPSVLDRDDYTGIDVGVPDEDVPGREGRDVIHIAGLYPIHEVERQLVDEYGLEPFWQLEWDHYSVQRQPAV